MLKHNFPTKYYKTYNSTIKKFSCVPMKCFDIDISITVFIVLPSTHYDVIHLLQFAQMISQKYNSIVKLMTNSNEQKMFCFHNFFSTEMNEIKFY